MSFLHNTHLFDLSLDHITYTLTFYIEECYRIILKNVINDVLQFTREYPHKMIVSQVIKYW